MNKRKVEVVSRDFHTKLQYVEAYKKEKVDNSISINAFAGRNKVNYFPFYNFFATYILDIITILYE